MKDTYLAEGDDLSIFIEYFCLVVLLKWSEQVRWVLQVLDKNMITTQSLTVERYEVSKYHDIHSESTDWTMDSFGGEGHSLVHILRQLIIVLSRWKLFCRKHIGGERCLRHCSCRVIQTRPRTGEKEMFHRDQNWEFRVKEWVVAWSDEELDVVSKDVVEWFDKDRRCKYCSLSCAQDELLFDVVTKNSPELPVGPQNGVDVSFPSVKAVSLLPAWTPAPTFLNLCRGFMEV